MHTQLSVCVMIVHGRIDKLPRVTDPDSTPDYDPEKWGISADLELSTG